MRIIVLTFAIALSAAAQAQPRQAAPEGWPCVQVYVESLSAGALWTGPPVEGLEARNDAEIGRLVPRITRLETPDEEVEAAITDFAAGASAERLTRLFAASFAAENEERKRVLAAILAFAKGQRRLLEQMAAQLQRLEQATGGEADEARAELDLTRQIFEDRQSSQELLCEQPRRHEARIGLIARVIEQHLGAPPHAPASAADSSRR